MKTKSAAKYHVDATGATEMIVYVTYGQAGGRNKDKAKSNDTIETGKGEMQHDKHSAKLIIEDFNAEPKSFNATKELIVDDLVCYTLRQTVFPGSTAIVHLLQYFSREYFEKIFVATFVSIYKVVL